MILELIFWITLILFMAIESFFLWLRDCFNGLFKRKKMNKKESDLNKFKDWKKNFVFVKTDLGLTNANYLLDDQFLLRQSKATTIFFIQRENEIKTIKLIKDQQINVPVIDHFFDENGNFIYITKFLKGVKNFAQVEKNDANLAQAAQLIKKLHKVDYQKSGIKQLNMKQNLINHIDLSKYNYDNEELNALIVNLKTFLDHFDWKKEIVLSHNDPLKENFLIDQNQNWYLIDFEYCSLNSPYYDIAVFASANELVKSLPLWKKWLQLFAINKLEEERTLLFFVLYRDVLGYFWARCMNLYNPSPKYVQLMTKKLTQTEKTIARIQIIDQDLKTV